MSLFFALFTLIGWGVGDIFVALASRKLGAKLSYFWGNILAFLLSSLYIPFAGKISDWRMFMLAGALNIIHVLGNISYFRGLEVGNATIVGTLSSAYSLVAIIISLLFFGESLTLSQGIPIVFILTGSILVSLNLEKLATLDKDKILTDKGIVYAFGSMIFWGIYFALVRIPAEKIGWFWAGYPLYLLTFTLPFIMKEVRTNTFRVFSSAKILITVLLMTLFITTADFSYNLGILKGFTSIVAPVAGAYPVVFVALARFVFKERLSKTQSAGIILSLLGIVLLGIS